MKFNLPVIGEVRINEKEEQVEKSMGLGTGFFDFPRIDDKSVSSQWINAYQGWVYANVSAIAEAVSYLEFELYRVRIVKDKIEYVPVKSHPLLDLLDRFNPFMATGDAMYITQSHVELAGDAFYLLDGDNIERGTNIRNIFILAPDKITVEPGDTSKGEDLIKQYVFKDTINGNRVEINYEPEQIIQIKNPNPQNPLRGKSVVQAAAETIDVDQLAIDSNKKFFKQGFLSNLFLTSEQRISKDDMARLETDFRRKFSGSSKHWKVPILSGLKPETVQMSHKEMQFLEQQEWSRDKIMALFKNTKTSLGITDDVNRANAESSMISWKENVIKTKMSRIVDTLNEFLVPRFGDGLILSFKDPVPENREEKIAELEKMITNVKNPVMTVNEARQLLDLEPLEGEEFDTIPSQQGSVQVQPVEVPKSIRNVNYAKHLRKMGIFEEEEIAKDLYDRARSIARKIIKKKKAPKKKQEEVRESLYFSNDQVWAYWEKQIGAVEDFENQFETKLKQFLSQLEEKVVSSIPTQKKWKKKQIAPFDADTEIQAGIDLFTPLMGELATIAGLDALDLIGEDGPYIVSPKLKDIVDSKVRLFTSSFIETDREKLVSLISDGLEAGKGVPVIEREIRETFENLRKVQVERIVRSEVLRTSNLASIDAWDQSGLVEAKQWLTARDSRVCPYCAPLNGKIIGLNRAFFRKGERYSGDSDRPLDLSYDTTIAPPLHVSCRCTTIPVLKSVNELQFEAVKSENDKLRKLNKDKESYITELEDLVGLNGSEKED